MRKVLIIVIAVIAALVVVDIGLRAYTESKTADAIAEKAGFAVKPDVSIESFPFLLGAIRGHYSTVIVTQNRVQVPSVAGVRAVLTLSDVDLPLSDALSSDIDNLSAESAVLDVRVPLQSLAAAIGRPNLTFSAGPSGALQVSATVNVAGRNVPVIGIGSVTVSDGSVQISFDRLSAAGVTLSGAASDAAGALASSLALDVPLADLPFDVTGATAVVDGTDLLLTVTTGGFVFSDLL